MNILRIPLDQIDATDRLRPIDPDYAMLIGASMAERGQMTPIEVRATPKGRLPYKLVSGGHRLDGARLFSIPEVDATLFEGSDLEAELREIEENLIRHELKELDRATFLARHKAVYEQLHPETRRGGKREKGSIRQFGALAFSAAAEERLGLSERTIERAITRYSRLHADVRARIAPLWIADHGAQLDALAKLPHSQQHSVADVLAQFPGISSVAEALAHAEGRRSPPPDPETAQFDAFMRLWKRMPTAVRKRVRAHVKNSGEV